MNTILLATCVSLILIALAWMAAKRDLTAAAARSNAPSLEELGELRETVERLIVVLESKAAEIEDRLQHHFDRIAIIDQGRSSIAVPASEPESSRIDVSRASQPEEAQPSVLTRAYELLEQGNDPRTVAQMTGLTVAEIETAARMKELRSGRR